MRKVKGYCPVCDTWRAFQITGVYRPVTPVSAIGTLAPVYFYHGDPQYTGICSRGHESRYRHWTPMHTPKYKRDVDPKDYKSRDIVDMAVYFHNYVTKYRRLDKEAHYMSGHVCTKDCPEYDWPAWEEM